MISPYRLLVLAVLFCWLSTLSSAFTLHRNSFAQGPLRRPQVLALQERQGSASFILSVPTYCIGTGTSHFVPGTMLRSFFKLASAKGPVQSTMEQKLQEVLSPAFMEIVNESAAHKGHPGNPAPHLDETHFTVRIRSEKFRGKSLVQQHRLIYDILKQELREGVHALSIQSSEPYPEDKS